MRRFRSDEWETRRVRDRAASPVIGYVLVLAVTATLVAGIITAGVGFVDDQRERGARSQMEVLGQQLAADLSAADRLVRTVDTSNTVSFERRFPQQVVGTPYRIELSSGTPPALELSTSDPDVTVTIDLTIDTAVDDSTASGGTVRVVFDTGSNALEVRDG